MTSRKALKSKAWHVIKSLDKDQLVKAVALLETISSSGELKIHAFHSHLNDKPFRHCYTNIPKDCLTITQDHPTMGPTKKWIREPVPNKMKPTYVLDDSILQHGVVYHPQDYPDCVLKNSDTVLFNGINQVVYEGYVFWHRYNGAISTLYVTKEDYDQQQNKFIVALDLLKRIIPIHTLDDEIKKHIELHAMWHHQHYDTSSGE